MSGTDLASVLAGAPLLPMLTVPSTATTGPLADALTAGGARCAEVTFRTPGAEQAQAARAPVAGSSSWAMTSSAREAKARRFQVP